jgi:hypothetical protein
VGGLIAMRRAAARSEAASLWLMPQTQSRMGKAVRPAPLIDHLLIESSTAEGVDWRWCRLAVVMLLLVLSLTEFSGLSFGTGRSGGGGSRLGVLRALL